MSNKVVLSSKVSPKTIKLLNQLASITGSTKSALLEELVATHYEHVSKMQPILRVIESKDDRDFISEKINEVMFSGLKDIIDQYMVHKHSQEYLQGKLEHKPEIRKGYWSHDHINNTNFWDDSMRVLIGVSKDLVPNIESFTKIVHPDDLPLTFELLAESVQKKTPYKAEIRIIMPNGVIRHIESKCHTTYDHFGNPLVSNGFSDFLYDE